MDIVSDEDCRHILKKALKTSDFELISWRGEKAFDSANGFLGDYVKLTIRFSDTEPHDKVFFVKRLGGNMNKYQIDMAKSLNVFEKEMYVYGTIVASCETLGMDVTFAPQCYLNKENTMVLEDLSVSGFKMPEEKMLDYENMESLIIALSKYHATSVLYEEIKSKELGRKYRLVDENSSIFKEALYSRDMKSSWEWIISSKCSFIRMVDYISMPSKKRKELLEILSTAENVLDKVTPHRTMRNTCNHGDLWCNNMMVRKIGGKMECRLLDFQVLRYYLPMSDVMLALYTNTTVDFRKKYAVDLIKIYYKNFSDMLSKSGVDPDEIIPFRDIVDSCRLVSQAAKFHGAMAKRLTFLPQNIQEKCVLNSDYFEDLIKDQSGKTFMSIYTTHPDYKKMLDEDLLDLYEVFMGKTIL